MKKLILFLVLLISISGYSQRTFTNCIAFDENGKETGEYALKVVVEMDDNDDVIFTYPTKSYTYTVIDVLEGKTKSGYGYVQLTLRLLGGNDVILFQVFDDKSFGVRLFLESGVFYQLQD